MKIKNPNAGALTNFEVLDFLRSRGASRDVSRVLAPVAASEYKVYDYLVETPACNLTREKINEFLERCKKYDLAKAELLNIINIRPSQTVEIYTVINLLFLLALCSPLLTYKSAIRSCELRFWCHFLKLLTNLLYAIRVAHRAVRLYMLA
uniref:DNA-directed RNA polymerase III subunit RPC9 n=1 Tax=Populus davidiana TaxID=266767 RepID=A0A6M2FCE1_9ROSI